MSNNMIKIREIIEKEKAIGISPCIEWLKSVSEREVPIRSLRSSILAILQKYKQFNKSKSRPGIEEKKDNFLNSYYSFPAQKSSHIAQRQTLDPALEILNEDKSCALNVVIDLAKDLNSSITEKRNLKDENDNLKISLRKRCNAKYKLKTKQHGVSGLKRQLNYLTSTIQNRNKLLKRLRSQYRYLNNQNIKQRDLLNEKVAQYSELSNQNINLQNELDSLRNKMRDEREENEYLRLLIQDNHMKSINLFDEQSRVYTKETQECVYELLNCNVTTSRVSNVIKTVLKLADITANKLPSVSTVNNMNVQRLLLSQTQLAEEVSKKESTCLLSDEASKFGQKFEGFHLCDNQGKLWVLGLRNIVTKGATDTLATFNEILDDISDSSKFSNNDSGKKILLNIVSTMSDRASTQIKFNELLEDYRTTILKEHLSDSWDAMNDAEKSSVTKLNNFFCGLHVLVHTAEVATSCLLEAERGLFEGCAPIYDATFRKANEPGTLRLVRTVCKAFSCGGDEKSGAHGPFSLYVKPFLKEKGMRSIPIERFRGNRFNILFSNAAGVYFMISKLKEFLQHNDNNRLLKSVKFDIHKHEYVAGCKALGLIAFLITVPLWQVIEDKSIHILDSSIYYREIIEFT